VKGDGNGSTESGSNACGGGGSNSAPPKKTTFTAISVRLAGRKPVQAAPEGHEQSIRLLLLEHLHQPSAAQG
jgi:hypothetical protein